MAAREPAEELTQAQLAELTADLHALKRELEAALESAASVAAPVDLDQPIGRLSRMDQIQAQQLAKATRHRHQKRLNQVEQALERVGEGDYGLCIVTGEPIGYRRLKARPETPVCLAAQAQMEQR
ncbi:MAG: TraR/DksA family transcriptional regulator [Myxococcales bacterium]|nr:TraR/DksA family transcriptional regulator [Myxococcales bacterium]MCB9526392.1 TraR/DksA family transcriptional regulator [Myxococcales bacterium]